MDELLTDALEPPEVEEGIWLSGLIHAMNKDLPWRRPMQVSIGPPSNLQSKPDLTSRAQPTGLISKSSALLPAASASTNHAGRFPRPVQVLPAPSEYFGGLAAVAVFHFVLVFGVFAAATPAA